METQPVPLSSTGESELDEKLLDETEAMIWALLDDQIDDAAVDRLEKLLLESPQVRQRYVECVSLHVDLAEHFSRCHSKPRENIDVVSSQIAEHLAGADGLRAGMEG